MWCYETTTVLVIGTGLHFRYDFVIAGNEREAAQIARAHWEKQGYIVDNSSADRPGGLPLSGKGGCSVNEQTSLDDLAAMCERHLYEAHDWDPKADEQLTVAWMQNLLLARQVQVLERIATLLEER